MSRAFFAATTAALLLSAGPIAAFDPTVAARSEGVAPEAAEAAGVVDAFHAALENGDTTAALALLAEEVVIFEEGGAERSRAEYASHHLDADAAYAAASEYTLGHRSGWIAGDVAWIASEGTPSDRPATGPQAG